MPFLVASQRHVVTKDQRIHLGFCGCLFLGAERLKTTLGGCKDGGGEMVLSMTTSIDEAQSNTTNKENREKQKLKTEETQREEFKKKKMLKDLDRDNDKRKKHAQLDTY